MTEIKITVPTTTTHADKSFISKETVDELLDGLIDQINEGFATKTSEASTLESSLTTEVQDRTNADTTLQSNIDALNTSLTAKMTDLTESTKTSLTSISDDFAKYNTSLAAMTKSYETLIADSSTEGSVDYKVAAAVASIVDGADEAYDTLKEIAAWILSGDNVTTSGGTAMTAGDMVTNIESIKSRVDTLEEFTPTSGTEDFDDGLYALTIRVSNGTVTNLWTKVQDISDTIVSASDVNNESSSN